MTDNKPEVQDSENFLWVQRVVLPKVIEKLGGDVRNFEFEMRPPNSYVYGSSVVLVELSFFSCGDERQKKTRLVVKVLPEDRAARDFFQAEIAFQNEILFYERLGKNSGDYPKCVLAIPEPVDNAAIVLEDVTQRGYRDLWHGEKLGMERVLAAVRAIGRFHGRGYVLKETNPEEFFKVAREVRGTLHDTITHPALIEIINGSSLRPVNYLRSVANFDAAFCDKITGSLSSAHEKIFEDCVKPRNDLAVLCHGDFTVANVLFREEDVGGIEAMLIDFAQFQFASPAIDLSTFLYLSCDAERLKDFSLIFRAYHDAVVERLEAEGVFDPEKYSITNFLNDYKRHAIFGYAVGLYHKPFLHLNEKPDFVSIINKPLDYVRVLNASGGDELSKELADMLLELKDNGCLDHLI